jgi:hypothetical protein
MKKLERDDDSKKGHPALVGIHRHDARPHLRRSCRPGAHRRRSAGRANAAVQLLTNRFPLIVEAIARLPSAPSMAKQGRAISAVEA